MKSSNKASLEMSKGVVIFCFFFAIVSGLSLYPAYHFLVFKTDTYGQVLGWNGDTVTMRYLIEGGDSITSTHTYPYTKDKKHINELERVPIIYNSKREHQFEIIGAGDNYYPILHTLVFIGACVAAVGSLSKYRKQ